MPKPSQEKTIVTNRKARHLYHILETVESGIVLAGTEVKSLRAGQASFVDAYASVERGELWLTGLNISHYVQGNRYNRNPDRKRKLLLHKRQVLKLSGNVETKGTTLVPLKLYFNAEGRVKVELALCRGKKVFDKRADIRDRDNRRDAEREMKDINLRRRDDD